MLAKIKIGTGSYGKLWTGTQLLANFKKLNEFMVKQPFKDSQEFIGNLFDCSIVERHCECGLVTRKFKAYPVEATSNISDYLDVKTVFITAGGVGSINTDNGTSPSLQVTNWSGRVGGHVIVDPLLVVNGYWERKDLPNVKNGAQWLCTYAGSTLSEFVLVSGEQEGHALETRKTTGKCPKCKQKEQEDARRFTS